MWNMQHCMAHHLMVSDFRYHQNWASGGAKTSLLNQKWLYFQSHLLSSKDIEYWRPPKDAPWKAAYFTYQALNNLINIGGLNWGNRLAKTGTEPTGSGFASNHYSRNGPKMEPLLTLLKGWFYFPSQWVISGSIISRNSRLTAVVKLKTINMSKNVL